MKTVLLTGFEPFDNETINSSWEAAQQLHGKDVSNVNVIALRLPCVFGASRRTLERAIQKHHPAFVIATGQANGRSDITPERVAINLDDARIADNVGQQPSDKLINKQGPAAYFTALPVKAIVAALHQAGLPASVSHTAGTFVCNHVFYALMAMHSRYAISRCGFIHVPQLPSQVINKPGAPSMALDDIVAGLRISVRTCVQPQRRIRVLDVNSND